MPHVLEAKSSLLDMKNDLIAATIDSATKGHVALDLSGGCVNRGAWGVAYHAIVLCKLLPVLPYPYRYTSSLRNAFLSIHSMSQSDFCDGCRLKLVFVLCVLMHPLYLMSLRGISLCNVANISHYFGKDFLAKYLVCDNGGNVGG